MPKKPIQDVIPPSEKKSIRNITLPNRGQTTENLISKKDAKFSTDLSKISTTTNHSHDESEKSKEFLTIPTVVSSERSEMMYKIAVFGGFLVAVGFVYLGYLFLHVGAIVTITPKMEEVFVKNLFTAKKNPNPSDLPFEVINLEEEASKTVPSTGEKKVENRATGRVIIYNDYSKQSQRLIKNTRLQSPEGLIFRIDSSVVVPGQSKKDGELIPGSIEVAVSADTAGEEYNIPLTDFTIPGFKGDPRYDKFYGRSKTTMVGGFKGMVKTASTKDLEAAKSELTASLRESLAKKSKEQTPGGFILYDNAIYIIFESMQTKDDNEVKIKAVLNGIIFNKDILASFIAKEALLTFDNAPVTSENLANLAFKPDSLEITPWQTGNLPFNLEGTTTILWLIDTNKIKTDLAGVAKSQVETVFRTYPGIARAQLELRPLWKSTLPEEANKIEIIIKK